jgi:PhzF family phenazine biosynthesis protein
MTVQVHVINAFSVNGQGGNPAGVVFHADALTTAQKQAIAAKAGFPETAFVSASTVADYKLDFFTPTKQIPHCGHATIATFSYLKSTGQIPNSQSSKETIDGCRTILFKEEVAFMEQQAPRFTTLANQQELLDSLGITSNDLIPGLEPMIVNTGNSFLIVPVKDQATLARIQYSEQAVYRISEQYGLIGFYLYTHSREFDATTRMFGPYYGIAEEAGTGMAAGPLAAYLWETGQNFKPYLRIEQGRFMTPASPSLILVDLDLAEGTIKRLFAGGGAYVSDTVEVNVLSEVEAAAL